MTVEVLFNPDLETSWVMVPALIGLTMAFIGTIITSPIPGGNTLVSAIGLSGALIAFGVPEAAAAAAVIAQQLIATYLPALPGWFATDRMLRRGLL